MQRSFLTVLVAISLVFAVSPSAQTPAADPSELLREVLPADVAARVLNRIAEARAQQLPAQALANRALKFAARGVEAHNIERSVNDHAERLLQARDALLETRSTRPSDDELEAGSEALRMGVDGAAVSTLAKSAPSGRSLAVPLFVIGSLVDRGLPSDEALQRVLERLQARASDAELELLPAQARGRGGRPAQTGRALGASRRPGSAVGGAGAGAAGSGGRPASLPPNPGQGKKPVSPPGQP
jgi:hypothetical protein